MPKTEEPKLLFDQLADFFESKVNELCDLHTLPEVFAEFMQKAMPNEISLLKCTLTEYSLGRAGLVECMRTYAESDEFEERPVIALPATEERPASPDWWTKGTPLAIDYTLSMVVDDTHEQDVELTRAEFIALKEHLATKMRGYPDQETPDE